MFVSQEIYHQINHSCDCSVENIYLSLDLDYQPHCGHGFPLLVMVSSILWTKRVGRRQKERRKNYLCKAVILYVSMYLGIHQVVPSADNFFFVGTITIYPFFWPFLANSNCLFKQYLKNKKFLVSSKKIPMRLVSFWSAWPANDSINIYYSVLVSGSFRIVRIFCHSIYLKDIDIFLMRQP